MSRRHRDRVGDILLAIADIRADTEGMNLATFEKNAVVIRSVLYSVGVIGEAIKAIDSDFKAAHPKFHGGPSTQSETASRMRISAAGRIHPLRSRTRPSLSFH